MKHQCLILFYRFRTLFLWLYAEPSILEQRLYDRVDKMIEARSVSRSYPSVR